MENSAELIAEALSRADDNPVEISIRSLLEAWGARRRREWIVWKIERDLREAGLATTPSFTDGWIDNRVKLIKVKVPSQDRLGETSHQKVHPEPVPLIRTMLRVEDIPSAHQGVAFVDQSSDLIVAQTLMLRYDYSQIAVLSGPHTHRGAISWGSIAVAQLRNPLASLREATFLSDPVDLGHGLLDLIPRVAKDGFVFVISPDKSLSGIITAADLSLEFSNLATPYFLLGEIERRIRRIVDECIPSAILSASLNTAVRARNVSSARDLTFGEFVRILENPENWSYLHWNIDRSIFISALSEVRELRNDVMHFSPDPFGELEIDVLRRFGQFLRELDPRP